MKKALYLSFLAAIVLTGCVEGDYGIKPADPQKWEQEDPISIPGGLTASAVAPIDLGSLEEESVAVAAATLPTLAEGTAKLAVILDETARIELDENLKALKSDLQDAVTAAYGKRPVAREFSAVLNMDIMVDGQATLVTSEPFTLTVTPEAPFIASAYYLVGDMTGWSENPETLIKFKHSDEDVYEDPVFTVTFECDGGCYWKIVPQTNVDAGNVWAEGPQGIVGVAVDGDEALEGQLIAGKCNAAKIVKGGKWQLTINMMEYTYSLKYIADNYYLVGTLQGQVSSAPNTNGWYDSKDYMNCLLYPTSDDNTYTYTSVFGKGDYAGYKIWNESDYGDWSLCYGTAVNNDASPSGTLVNTGAGSICLPTSSTEDVYTINIDLKNMTYSHEAYTGDVTRYDAVGLIGDFTSWKTDIDMTEVSVHNWCAKNVVIAETTQIKFRANHEWKVDWGGQESGIDLSASTYGVGKQGGGNFSIPAGTYDFYLNTLTGRYAVIAR